MTSREGKRDIAFRFLRVFVYIGNVARRGNGHSWVSGCHGERSYGVAYRELERSSRRLVGLLLASPSIWLNGSAWPRSILGLVDCTPQWTITAALVLKDECGASEAAFGDAGSMSNWLSPHTRTTSCKLAGKCQAQCYL